MIVIYIILLLILTQRDTLYQKQHEPLSKVAGEQRHQVSDICNLNKRFP